MEQRMADRKEVIQHIMEERLEEEKRSKYRTEDGGREKT